MKVSSSTVPCALIAYTLLVAHPGPGIARDVPAGLRPMAPVTCNGTEDVEIYSRHIVAEGNAVEAFGNCDVEIHDSYIEATGVGVLAGGNGDVELYNTYVEGGRGGLVAEGNSEITVTGSDIEGGVFVHGNADIEDAAGNQYRADDFDGPADVQIGPGGLRVESGRGTVVIDERGVRRVESGAGVEVEGDWRGPGRNATTEDLQRLLAELGATVEEGRLSLEMAGDVLFDFDSTAIRGDAAAELAKVAQVIRQGSEGTVSVVGHTDSVGSDSYNQDLSERRAQSVAHWLARNEGIPAHVMRASGVGETRPVAHNTTPDGADNPDGRAKNRRVEVSFEARESVRVAAGAVEVREPATGAPPDACAAICSDWPALNDLQRACVVTALDNRGYEVLGTVGCIDVRSAGQCRTCWRTLRVGPADCEAVQSSCFGR